MLRPALLVALALAACGADPSPPAADDAAADVAPDAAPPPDAPQDAAAPPDLTPPADVAGPDTPPPIDAGPDNGPDVRTDTGPDVAPDREDAPPADPLLEQVSAVRVTASVPGVSWDSARAQSCSVTGGMVSVGAEYSSPSAATFTVTGPLSGPVVLTVVTTGGGASDVRAMVRASAEYLTDGASVRRINVAVRGMPGANPVVDVIALGCVVR